ncbi:hypothetical protein [Actinopolymorpha alba]|uniref:hypothetical protein n=1 Tax=Actinopolymorpha alba TaxID=533267 RepID=UPI0006849FDA|nr:hypothetical protein [Actinopolymorpha alba]
MRGDRVEIVIDAGGQTRTYDVTATRNGRRVEITTGRGIVEVSEVTRGGTAVRTARFMASRVLALVEHPASRERLPDDELPPPRPGHEAREAAEDHTYL